MTEHVLLRLYISGATPQSARAIENARAVCEKHLGGRYSLQIVDVYQQPQLTNEDRIRATPTLVRHSPLPKRHVVGDFTDMQRVLRELGLSENGT